MMPLDEDYRDAEGTPTTLEHLVRMEPDWACNAIRMFRARVLELEAQQEKLYDKLAQLAAAGTGHSQQTADAITKERDDFRAKYEFMVERACNEKLDGYRALGARAAVAEEARDRAQAEFMLVLGFLRRKAADARKHADHLLADSSQNAPDAERWNLRAAVLAETVEQLVAGWHGR